jgi:hypothetical protein
LAHPLIS